MVQIGRAWDRFRGPIVFDKVDLQQAPEVTVVIPCIYKDLPVLPYVVNGLRDHLRHKIRKIIILSPRNQDIVETANSLNCEFVFEGDILPEGPKYYDKYYKNSLHHKGAWLYQQLLKFEISKHLPTENYITFDADTVMIRPVAFMHSAKRLLFYSDAYRPDLFQLNRNLIPEIQQPFRSFITHSMMFTKSVVSELLSSIESHSKQNWKESIAGNVDPSREISFSEFEMYAQFSITKERKQIRLPYWFYKNRKRKDLDLLEDLAKEFRSRNYYISFQNYMR